MADHPVPKTKIDTLKDIIEGYYEAGDVGDIIEDEDVEKQIDVGADTISRQKKFLADIGVLEKDGYDYLLLEAGREIGRALAYDRNEDASNALKQLLNSWEVTDQIRSDIGVDSRSRPEIIDSFAYLTETDTSSPRKRTGLSTLVDLYIWTGILSEETEGQFTLSGGKEDKEVPTEDKSDTEVSEPPVETANETISENEAISVQSRNASTAILSIDMELSGDEDPEKIKKLIMAIREGLQEEIVSNDSSQGDEEKEKQPATSDDQLITEF